MKTLKLIFAVAVVFGFQNLSAQDNNDTNEASHSLTVDVPEVAIIDIFDAATGTEAGPITMNMDNVTKVANNNSEAGLYAFGDERYSSLYLNYTSVVGAAGTTFDQTRTIDVKLENGSELPGSVDFVITPSAAAIDPMGGDASSRGTIKPAAKFGVTTPINTSVVLVENIKSIYSGDGAKGVQLEYSLEQNGNFSAYQADTYTASVLYTISDL
ncbi:hypothetical protein [Reichenbachiella sp. MALMAid0571]|uniref:hypothetical protein n=1 Tax=Reichenbachiella sp. MALMAid0571 TaxID=3143939 RepID=UPI0032DEC658